MPFYKTHEVPMEFFNIFLKKAIRKKIDGDSLNEHPMLQIPLHTGEVSNFMFRYYNRSGSQEDTMEYYPCVVVQDYQPKINTELLWGKDYVEGIVDSLRGKRELITLPIPYIYRFQVSSVTKRLKEIQGINDWFAQNFQLHRPSCLELNSFETSEGVVADIVPCTITDKEVSRDDGRFEYAYEFSLKTFVHARAKNYIPSGDSTLHQDDNFFDIIEKIKVSLHMKSVPDFTKVLQQEFYIT